MTQDDSDRVRLDKWLWAARFYKTRSAATEAVAGGKVELNGERAKPAKAVKPGDEIRLRLGPYEHILIVRQLGERRGPGSRPPAFLREHRRKPRRARAAERATPHGAAYVRLRGERPSDEEGPPRS